MAGLGRLKEELARRGHDRSSSPVEDASFNLEFCA